MSMSKKTYRHFTVSKLFWILFFSLAISIFAKGNPYSDTAKKLLLASLNKTEKARYITRETNVVFPDVLSGNEDESLEYIKKFSITRRAYIIRTYNRSRKYFPKVCTIFKKYDLPHELKILMALESAFNGNAVSRTGAVGYWQFMDNVAKEYGLKYSTHLTAAEKKKQKLEIKKSISKNTTRGTKKVKLVNTRDDRKDFNKSTYAAARYLKDRSRNLNNDLLLMVASYNCGVGNVWEAMKKTGKDNPTFWDIKNYLPAETRAYVMNFITLNVLFHNYENFTNNALLFTPAKFKLDNFESNITDELTTPGSQN